ncbi:MAG: PAS domain S-box protein [Flavobacteriales bacterium]
MKSTEGSGIPRPQKDELGRAYLELKQQYDNLVGKNVAGVFRSSLQGRFLECNDAMARLLGYADRAELMATPASELYFTTEVRERLIADLREHGRLMNYAVTLRHKSGRAVEVLENIFLGRIEGRAATIEGTLIDVTAFRHAEFEQRSLMENYRQLVEHVSDGILIVQEDRVRYANPAAERLTGRTTLAGAQLSTLVQDADVQRLAHWLTEVPEQGNANPTEVRWLLPSGVPREMQVTAARIRYEGAEALQLSIEDRKEQDTLARERMRATIAEEVNEVLRHEIGQHRRTQEELSRSKRFARSLVDSSLDAIIAVDREVCVTEFNPAASIKFGYEPAEIVGQHARILYASEAEHARVLSELDSHGAFTGEVRNKDRDGKEFISFLAASRLYDENGVLLGSMGVSRDITKAKEDQERLDHETAKLRALFESGEHMFWTVSRDIGLTSFNQGYADMVERLYGKRPTIHSDVALPRKKFASEEYHQFWEQQYDQAFAGKTLRFETEVKAKDGSTVCNEIFLSPVIGSDGEVDEVFGIGHEVTEQVMAERTVRDQAARIKAIFENSANVMIWTLDRDFRITAFNEHFQESNLRGLGIRYKVGDPFIDDMKQRVAGGKWKPVVAYYEAAMTGQPQHFEVELDNGKGRMLWVENFLNPIVVDGEVREVSCLAHGITDRKDAQRRMQESLHEKEVLLKEVHHRVKNNLQIISSILNLQSAYVGGDRRMLDLLRDSQDRVRSMSFIHESLYQAKNFSSVDLGGYIDSLARNLMMSYSLNGKVRLNTDVQKVELGLDQAIPCGLILNELLSNALKHAFPNGAEGVIDLKVELAGRQVRIAMADNGVGLPGDFHEERSANLGLQLVQTLAGQIDGRIERKPGGGAHWVLTFDRNTPQQSGNPGSDRP